MALLHKCWDRDKLPFALLFLWPYGSCILPRALAKTEEVTLSVSLLHSIFLSSGDLNRTPGMYQAYLSSECLPPSSPIPLLNEGDQGQRSNCTSLVNGPRAAFRSCLPQPSPIFFYLSTWEWAVMAGSCSGGGLSWLAQGVMEQGVSLGEQGCAVGNGFAPAGVPGRRDKF